MDLQQITQRAWERNTLLAVLLELTYRCNLDCVFCYNDRALSGRPLTTDQWLALLNELAELQVLNLTLSGGEPLAHPDFFRIGGAARDLGFVVRLKTNGHAVTERLAARLREEVDPFLVEVSVHGATPAVHDRQTRVRGSFDRLLRTVRHLRSSGLRTRLAFTLTVWNHHELEAVFDLADRLDVRLQVAPQVTPRDDGDRSPLTLAPPPEAVARLLALIEARRGGDDIEPCTGETPPAARKSCGAGSAGLAVDPFGTVYPCVQWRRPLGSLHEHPVREIWRASADLPVVRRLAELAGDRLRRLGSAATATSFCLGIAEQHTGDPLGLYDAFRTEWRLRSGSPTAPVTLPLYDAYEEAG